MFAFLELYLLSSVNDGHHGQVRGVGDAAVQEMVRIIHLRADFHPSMLKVQSPKKDDAE